MYINIPIILHIFDPLLCHEDSGAFFQRKIIPQINWDFNINIKYQKVYLSHVKKLFKYAHYDKLSYYLDCSRTLPNGKYHWEFKLLYTNYSPRTLTVETIYSEYFGNLDVHLPVDPPDHLDIVIVPGKQLMGITTTLHKNTIIISSNIFRGCQPHYQKFHTFTHEIGHWCGLYHPFDPRNSCIVDMSPQKKATRGFVYDKIINGKRVTPYASIFEKNDDYPNFYNFMDYTDDHQRCLFTQCQIETMVNVLQKNHPNMFGILPVINKK